MPCPITQVRGLLLSLSPESPAGVLGFQVLGPGAGYSEPDGTSTRTELSV